ncbi:helix-turn-helix transcriptional regulator [Magnetococcus sp. PR-3]|uniref:helix-turn-helix transcriptional regulator n=1 Tax=Magnetococcus sp. PR-3 TaxID=3120355 RepID=UPI003FA59C16
MGSMEEAIQLSMIEALQQSGLLKELKSLREEVSQLRKTTAHNSEDRVISSSELQKLLGVSRTTINEMLRTGRLPKPVQLSNSRKGWSMKMIERWIQTESEGASQHTAPDQ